MSPRASAIVSVAGDGGGLTSTLEQVRRQRRAADEIVIACSASASPGMLAGLRRDPRGAGVAALALDGTSPGAVRNRGLEAATGEVAFFVESGDLLDPGYLEAACRRFAERPGLDVVASWSLGPAERSLREIRKPVLTLEAVLGRPASVPTAAVFRRALWERLGGFDESLEGGEWYDLWIRAFEAGARGEVLEEALVRHEPSRLSAYRLALEGEPFTRGMRAVFEKHLDLFRRHLVTALRERDADIRWLPGRYRRALRTRNGLVAERAELEARAAEAAGRLGAVGRETLDWGDLRRTTPFDPNWGFGRGSPVDRYYIERFLEEHAGDVRGEVLEVQEADYTRRFGGERVTRSDVLDVDAANPLANLTGDLRQLREIPDGRYDCVILTQTVHVIDDVVAVAAEAVRILKPGGVLLATFPCASRVCLEYGPDGDFWRFTEAGVRRLFSGLVPPSGLELRSFGSVLSSAAFLQGLSEHELSAEELERFDPFHPMLVGARVRKPGAPAAGSPARRGAGVVLMYHRVAAPPLDVHRLCVAPEAFREQMAYVASRCRPMSLIALAEAAREGWIPERAVAVTFDDGYADNLLEASPILLEHRVPATFFPTSDPFERRELFWWDELAWIFYGPAALPARLELGWDGGVSLPTASPAERERAHGDLYPRIRDAGLDERDRRIGELRAWAGIGVPREIGRILTDAELVELSRRPGHSIGGHGMHHLSLPAQAADVVRREVRENRTLLEHTIGRLVSCFAFPFGEFDETTVEIVSEIGYRAAVTCVEDVVRPGQDPLRLPRVEVNPDAGASFAGRLEALFASR